MASLEGRVREHIQAHVNRGNISVSIRRDGDAADAPSLVVDFGAGRRYYDALKQLQDLLDLPGEITIDIFCLLYTSDAADE